MKGKQVFALSVISLAVSQALYAEPSVLPEVSVTSTTIDDRFDSKRGEPSNINNISGKKVDEEHGLWPPQKNWRAKTTSPCLP